MYDKLTWRVKSVRVSCWWCGMKNFVLAVIVRIVIPLCGYKPYQIGMEGGEIRAEVETMRS